MKKLLLIISLMIAISLFAVEKIDVLEMIRFLNALAFGSRSCSLG